MNKKCRFFRALGFGVVMLAAALLTASSYAQEKKNAAGEQFFIVSSVDAPNSRLLLKRASEVTLLMKVDSKTKYLDESGKPIRLSDLRAGDTVWVLVGKSGTEPTASRIRMGPMTVAELHRDYLDYPEIK
ncbi:MAG TPA: hypothetical protein VN661_04710 [Candidatus Acidoferrales bacterium]|nr:hypothetical protein [Candidatus Acidoferrales bacterium]